MAIKSKKADPLRKWGGGGITQTLPLEPRGCRGRHRDIKGEKLTGCEQRACIKARGQGFHPPLGLRTENGKANVAAA